uniref:Uncharacterized protein n=1 Tax=Lepeophtheirus salmonis TaxID=72036 RepID=A0A0K2TZ64_LEPSM
MLKHTKSTITFEEIEMLSSNYILRVQGPTKQIEILKTN